MTYHFYALYNGKVYPERYYLGYSKKEAIARYKAEYNLKYKRNVRLYHAIGGGVFN